MGHFLHFGAGPNQLPEPWQNLNGGHDIRKPLRFADESASFILAEHVIEHVPFLAGFGFLQECWRVLEPGGVLRLSFPDVTNFVSKLTGPVWRFQREALTYAQALEHRPQGEIIRRCEGREKCRAALLMLFAGWQHQSAWTEAMAAGVLLAHGFADVVSIRYGGSPADALRDVDGHHKDVGREIAVLESTILEATK